MFDIQKKSVARAVASAALALVTIAAPATALAANFTVQPMHRLYNPNSGEHFYTASWRERDHLTGVGWRYEGLSWWSPIVSWTRVYRVYNPNSGLHHYTTDVGERDALMSLGWRNEGVGWYSADSRDIAVYRLYNPNDGQHHYTCSLNEANQLASIGWNLEGTAWYGSMPVEDYYID